MRAAALALLLAGLAAAQVAVPTLTGRVVDRAGILSPHVEAALTARLAAHEDSTSNQVAVLTVPSLEGEVLEPFATRVFRAWGLGQADRDNGVLLLVARDDRQVRIEVGYGLEGDLTDAAAGSIIRGEIVPRFRDGDYDGGVLGGVEAILARLGDADPAWQPADTTPLRRPDIRLNGEPAETASVWLRLVFFLVFGACGMIPVAKLLSVPGTPGRGRDLSLGCAGLFGGAFLGAGAVTLFLTGWTICGGIVLVPVLAVAVNRWLDAHPVYGPRRERERERLAVLREARARGDTEYEFEGTTYTVPVVTSGGGGSSGGGFSGGGGSSGGGGASGSW